MGSLKSLDPQIARQRSCVSKEHTVSPHPLQLLWVLRSFPRVGINRHICHWTGLLTPTSTPMPSLTKAKSHGHAFNFPRWHGLYWLLFMCVCLHNCQRLKPFDNCRARLQDAVGAMVQLLLSPRYIIEILLDTHL